MGRLPEGPGVELAVQNPGRCPTATVRALGPWLRSLLGELAPGADSLAVRFVSAREMRELNRTFRQRNESTDVLSFPGEDTPEGRHLGDIVISVPTARRQAAAARLELDREIRQLVLHGVLHCLGYDHETDNGRMAALEARLRQRFLADPSSRVKR